MTTFNYQGMECFRPLSRYGWGPTLLNLNCQTLVKSFRPLSRYGWGPTHENEETKNGKRKFPSPLEAWEVPTLGDVAVGDDLTLFPSLLEAWGVSYGKIHVDFNYGFKLVSVPSRGLGSFLPHILYPQRKSTHKIVPTWKLS